MSKAIFRSVLILAPSAAALSVMSYIMPELGCIALAIAFDALLVVLIAINVTFGIAGGSDRKPSWMVAAFVGLAGLIFSIYVASPAGRFISDSLFLQNQEEYRKIVLRFKDRRLDCSRQCMDDSNFNGLIVEHPSRIHEVFGAYCDDGGVIVLFFGKTDVPLVHYGYMFRDYRDSSNCAKRYGSHDNFRWQYPFYTRRTETGWFRFSDQPGF